MNVRISLLTALLLSTASTWTHGAGSQSDYDLALSLAKRTENKVWRADFEPHWLPDQHRLWYRVKTGPSTWEFVLVDAESGAIQRAPDAASLALPTLSSTTSTLEGLEARPSGRTGEETSIRFLNHLTAAVDLFWIDSQGQRHSYGQVAPQEERRMSTFAGHVWLLADSTGATLAVLEAGNDPAEIVIDGPGHPHATAPEGASPRDSHRSPDSQWEVRFADQNVQLVNVASHENIALTHDGTAQRPCHGPVAWSPDSKYFTVLSVETVEPRRVTEVESSPADQTQPKTISFPYQKPGDNLPHPRPVLVSVADRAVVPVSDSLFVYPFSPEGDLSVRWSDRSDEFYFDYNQRGHQDYRIIAVNAASGTARVLVEETAKTFIDYTQKTWRQWLAKSGELLWMSERDGWCHLYLYDVVTGALKNRVTSGAWVVRHVLKVDEQARTVWFLASGLRAGEDPYHQHLCRAGLDGTGFVQLTSGDGDHRIDFSPDGRFFVDHWSRADQPPVAELHRSDSGTLVCELERADASALLAAGWTMPERFVAPGRDGRTSIHGVIIKPSHFDPAKNYPVLEQVYAGPHGAFVPKTFGHELLPHALAELGFIVVQSDGMGTNHRGKIFHDVCWKNLRDAGFPDRIAWIKAAAASRPWMDLSHVGIYGGSAGGQNAMRALLEHHDFYQAAFADCGCHDNRMDKIWWNEQWMGWPVDESYQRSSNVADAAKLQGHLMLCVGELDHNVDPASTMQVVNALIKADKDFELLIVPGQGHGAAETPYASRRRMDFFVRQLLGVEPRHL